MSLSSTPGMIVGRLPGVRALHARRPVRPGQAEGGVRVVLHVEVDGVGGRKDELRAVGHERLGRHVHAIRRGHEAPVLADRGVGELGTGGARLVPGDRRLAEVGDDLARSRHELGEVVGIRAERLVAAEVEVGAGRHRGEFAEHVGDEVVGGLVVDLQRREADHRALVRLAGDGCRDALAARLIEHLIVHRRRFGELGIGEADRVRVARHVDLGHDDHVTGCRVLDDLAVVGLRVEAAGVAVDGRA